MQTTPLPPLAEKLVQRYIEGMNAQDADAVTRCFAPDAIVEDESKRHTGTLAIHAWISQAMASYQPRLTLLSCEKSGASLQFTAQVAGTFPGSPIQLEHTLHEQSGLATRLVIRPAE